MLTVPNPFILNVFANPGDRSNSRPLTYGPRSTTCAFTQTPPLQSVCQLCKGNVR